jgi:hypothetical protein
MQETLLRYHSGDPLLARAAPGKYLRNDHRELRDENYNRIVKQNLILPPGPALPGLATIPKATKSRTTIAKTFNPEEFVDNWFVQE